MSGGDGERKAWEEKHRMRGWINKRGKKEELIGREGELERKEG